MSSSSRAHAESLALFPQVLVPNETRAWSKEWTGASMCRRDEARSRGRWRNALLHQTLAADDAGREWRARASPADRTRDFH